MRVLFLLTLLLLAVGCQTTPIPPTPVQDNTDTIKKADTTFSPIQYRYMETTPPNVILPAPQVENYTAPGPNSRYSNPQKAYTYDMLEYQNYVSRYINSLLEYNKILGIEDEGLIVCSGNRTFPVPVIDAPPTSPDISSYPTRQEGFRAFLDYAQALNDYAVNLRAEFLKQVDAFNQQCNE